MMTTLAPLMAVTKNLDVGLPISFVMITMLAPLMAVILKLDVIITI
jgi:hypothetical protein